MKKIKLLSTICFAIAFAFMSTTTVFASNQRSKPYYTNLNGVELTEQQYRNLSRIFEEDTIAALTQGQVDMLADDPNLVSASSTKYIKTESIVDIFGNEIAYSEEEVSEEEAMEFVENPPVQLRGVPKHTTAMKELKITAGGGISSKSITVTCTWLAGQMPVTRSHDVIATSPLNKTATINSGNISGYLKHNNTTTNYTGSNTTYVRNISGQGVGISMPLPTGGTSMSHQVTFAVISNVNPYTVYGSFQHAQSAVSLADSKVYNLVIPANSGRTNIINFTNSTTAGKYDNMQNVWCTFDPYTISCD